MNKKSFFTMWGGLYILCAGLGFINRPQGIAKVLLILAAVVFFVPPLVMIWQSSKKRDVFTLRLLRNLSVLSLLLTVVLFGANVASIAASEAVGNVLHILLGLISAPMYCGQHWILSLFGWACILVYAVGEIRKLKK